MGFLRNSNCGIGRSLGFLVLSILFVVGLSSQAMAADLTVDDTSDTGNTTDTTVVTLTAADDDFTVTTATADTAVTHSTGTITLSGGTNDILVTHLDADGTAGTTAVSLTVNGNVDNQTGSLSVVNDESTTGVTGSTLMTVTGTTSIATTTAITSSGASDTASNTATLTLQGNATLTGVVTLNATGPTVASSDAILNLQGATNTLTGGVVLNDGAAAQAVVNVNGAGVQSVSGVIDGAVATEGTLTVTDSTADAASDLKTFTGAIGVTQQLAAVEVGSATLAGSAQFQAAVDSVLITVFGGDNAAETGLAEFQNSVTATTIVLQDATGVTTMTVNATNGAQTVAGTIDGGAAGEGTLAVIDDDAGAAPDAITFSGRIGGTSAQVGAITVGNSTQGGAAIFTSANPVVVGTLTVTGGDNAAEDSTVELQDALTATTVTLNDGLGTATLTINTTNGAKTIAGAISGAAAGEGALTITDDDSGESDLATFSNAVGGTSLGTINIGSSTLGGDANFGSTAAATTVNITGGDAASENAGGVFVGAATFSNLNLTGGSNGTGDDATAQFQATGTNALGTVTLNDGTMSDAIVTVNTTNGVTTVSGTIDGAVAGEGTLTVIDDDAGVAAQAATFSGNIGATNSLKAINVGTVGGAADASSAVFSGTTAATTITLTAGNAANETALATFTGAVTATNINVIGDTNAAATATFGGNISATAISLDTVTGVAGMVMAGTTQSVTGTINGAAAGDGTLTVNANSISTFNSAIGGTNRLAAITVASSGQAVFGSTVAATAITTTGKTTFKGAVTMTGGALTINDNATIVVGSALSGGTVITTDTASIDPASANGATIEMAANFTSGTTTIIQGSAGAGIAIANFQVTSSALATYALSTDGSNQDLIVTATKNSTSAIAANLGVTEAAGAALDNGSTALAGDTANLALLTTVLNAGGSAAKEAAEQLQGSPAALSAAGSAAVTATGSQVIAVGSSRLASLRSGAQFASSQASGFAGGAEANKFGVWMKPFVNFGDQDQRKGVAGYETDTYGIAMGGDVKVGDSRRTTLGMSFSYADTDVDSKGADRARTGIDSYQATLYADYTTNKWYVEGLVGFARNEIDTTRNITFSSQTASADYGSNQFMFNIGGGMPMEVAKNHFITPNASFQYTLVENETYTETGAGALNLRVDQDEVHIAMGIFGARYHTHTEMKSGTLTPEIRTALTYDFAGDDGQSTSTFNGGGAAFSVTGADVVELGYTAGLGLSYAPLENQGLTISANYDWNQKTDFVGHSANFALRYEF